MKSLSWLSDADLSAHVGTLVNRINEAKKDSSIRIEKNVIDPFSSLIIASTLSVDTVDHLVNIQKGSSTLSAIANALGEFHQNILGSVNGWENHDAGYDLENVNKKMLAEVKNKHNTMNASSRQNVVEDLDTAIKQKGRSWKGYLVIIIPKRPERYEKRLHTQRPVYEIDGASFYTKITGYKKALHALFSVLMTELESTTQREVHDEVKSHCQTLLNTSIPN